MAELQRQVGAALVGFVQSDGVQLVFRVVALYVVAVWLACAWWAFRDAYQRTGNRVASYLAAAWVILFSPLFFPFALLVYRLVRPPELLVDALDRRLAEAAFLAERDVEVEECPRCSRTIDSSWVACPSCRLLLARLCPGCGRGASFDWLACAWCGEPLEVVGDPAERRPTVPAAMRREIEPPPAVVAPLSPALAVGGTAAFAAVTPESVDPPAFIEAAAPERRLGTRERRPGRGRTGRDDRWADRREDRQVV